jgi:hypothetical protein
MAEPLSVIASAIAVIATSATCAKTLLGIIKDLRDAPDDLLVLSNEVTNITCIIDEAKEVCEGLASDDSSNPKLIETLEGLLKEAEGVLGDLTDMVSKYKSKLQILDQSVWWLRQKSTAKKYIMKLQDIRTKITELLNSKTRPVNLYFKFNILRTISG